MKKIVIIFIVMGTATTIKAQLGLSISGPDSLVANETGTYAVSYSGAAILGADVDIIVDSGLIGGGIILTTNRDTDLDFQGTNPATGNYEVSIINDVLETDLGSPLFSFVLTTPSTIPEGNNITISLLENSFIDLSWNLITGTVMPTKQVTITPFIPQLNVTRCTVKAGKTQGRNAGDTTNIKDYFAASGTADFPADLNDINAIEVNIIDVCSNTAVYYQSINFNNHSDVILKKGKYSYTYKIAKGEAGEITSLKIDFRKNPSVFSVIAKNIDLTGLSCPLKLGFITDNNALISQDVNEAIINGKKILIPTRLMRMAKDTLVVRKTRAKNGAKPLGDSLFVSGDIAVANMNLDTNEPNLVNEDVNVIWGNNTFMIPSGSFKTVGRKHLYKCSRITSDNDSNNLVTAAIDLDNCTYTVSIVDFDFTDIENSDSVTFGINFATPDGDFNTIADVNLDTGRSYQSAL